jgi:SAM-dependent methyltransferase
VHTAAFRFIANQISNLPSGPVVEIGGRDINGSIRVLFPDVPYTSIDLEAGPGVDVVADGATYVPDEKAAVVVCCEVLEHAENAYQICENAYAMLRPGGVFLVTAAGNGRPEHSAVDGGHLRDGEFYRNVSLDQMCAWLWQFPPRMVVSVNDHAKDIYAMATK